MDNFTTNATRTNNQKYYVGWTIFSVPISSTPCRRERFPQPSSYQLLSSLSIAPFHSTLPVDKDHTENITMAEERYHGFNAVLNSFEKAPPTYKFSEVKSSVLTNDFIMALLVSSSASLYMSLKNLFSAASPSSFSSFSWYRKLTSYGIETQAISCLIRNTNIQIPTSFFTWASSLSQSTLLGLEEGYVGFSLPVETKEGSVSHISSYTRYVKNVWRD